MSEFKNNTYLTDLEVNDKVVEHHKYTGLRYVSKVVEVTANSVLVERLNGDRCTYDKNSGLIRTYGKSVPEFMLLQYIPANAPTPFNPSEVADDAENLLPY